MMRADANDCFLPIATFRDRHRLRPLWVQKLCENSDVELARRNFVSITLNGKRTALAVTVKGGQGRKQFCAFSARARFHTAWVIGYRNPMSALRPFFPIATK